MAKKTLQTTVVAARTRKFLTQQQLALLADVSESSIANIERGQVETITPRIAAKLGQKKALDTDLTEFINQ